MARDRFFRKVDKNINATNSVRLGELLREEIDRLSNLPRPAFFVLFVENSYEEEGADWQEFFSDLATRTITQRLADSKMKAYAVSEDEHDVRIISKRYWKTKDDRLNVAAIADRLFAASLGEDLDPHAPSTVANLAVPLGPSGTCLSETLMGYKLFIPKTDLDAWHRCSELTIDGLKWRQSTVQREYDRLPQDRQAEMSNDDLIGAAKGSGVTVRQVRALERSIRPARGRKARRDK